jgi:hypothetical protein
MPGLMLDYRYDTGDPELDATALEVWRLRRQADELAAAVTARTSEVAAQLVTRACLSAMSPRCWASARSAFLSTRRRPADLAAREPQSCPGCGY